VIEPEDFSEHLDSSGADQDHSAIDLYERIVVRKEDFWEVVYQSFMSRDLNRAQVRAFISKVLSDARGRYRDVVSLLGMPTSSYQRFMDFLRHNDLKP